jgi:phage I-like protein
MTRVRTLLTIPIEGESAPREFRIFRAGANDTVKGVFLFDEAAAASVLAEFDAHGIELMIDWDHASLDTSAARDPAEAGKAAGWCTLEVRDGELWAVNVRWTDAAAEKIAAREWRFMSPAFNTDREGRVTSLLNVAITNLPATRRLDPLVAASLSGGSMGPDVVQKAIEAIKTGDAEAALALLEEMLVSDATGAEEVAEEAPAAPAEMMAEAPAEDEKVAEMTAAASRLVELSGRATLGEAVDEVAIWRASHLKQIEAEAKLAAERKALDSVQRRDLVKTLIELGAETPHTSGLAKGKLVARLEGEPIAELKTRVAALLAARGGKVPTAAVPPASAPESHGLTAEELELCTKKKIDPAKFAATRAGIRARSNAQPTGV